MDVLQNNMDTFRSFKLKNVSIIKILALKQD